MRDFTESLSVILCIIRDHMKSNEYCPSFFETIRRGYTKDAFFADLMAGLTVGIISLPLGIAIAIGSGVDPARGVFTSIIAGFLVALLGGSRFQIAGPTGVFVVLVFDIVQRQGYDGLAVATLMAGFFLILMGACRVGSFLKFIPYPVLAGLTTGIGVTLFSSQLKDFFELQLPYQTVDFLEKWSLYFEAFPTLNWVTCTVGTLAVLFMAFLKYKWPKIPAAVVAVLLGAFVVWVFSLPVATIESRFGLLPDHLPVPSFPVFTLARLRELLPDAISVAILAGIESLLSASVADGMAGDRHRSNCELVAQGIGNIGSILFGGIPVTGSIARTATNVRLGAKSAMSGIVHAVVILIALLCFSVAASQIPLTILAAVLIVTAWHMADVPRFWSLLKSSFADGALLLSTFFLTVLLDVSVAVQVGVLLAALLFMKKMAQTTKLRVLRQVLHREIHPPHVHERVAKLPPHVEWMEVQGPLFFGASDLFNEFFSQADPATRVVILSLASVPMIDSTGIETLGQLIEQCHDRGWKLFLCDIHPSAKKDLENSELLILLGEECVFADLEHALSAVRVMT